MVSVFHLPAEASILKLQMPGTRVGMSDKRRLEAKHDEVGDACFFGQHQRLVVLGAQVALHPDEVDGLLGRWHFYEQGTALIVKQIGGVL